MARNTGEAPYVFALPFGFGEAVWSHPWLGIEIEDLQSHQTGFLVRDQPFPDVLDVHHHEFAWLPPGATVTVMPREGWSFSWPKELKNREGRFRLRCVYDSSLPAEKWQYDAGGPVDDSIEVCIEASAKARVVSDWREVTLSGQ